MPHKMRAQEREAAEREMAEWVDRWCCPGDGFSRMECLSIADAALEAKRLREVERIRVLQLRDTPDGRAEAAALERDGD